MRRSLRILAHAAVIAALWLIFAFAMYLGLQVDPVYGTAGIVVTTLLLATYVYLGFGRTRRRAPK